MRAAVIFLKPVNLGKTRLRSFLSDSDRHALIYCMLQDVLSAVCHARYLDEVWLTTMDPRAKMIASASGVKVFDENSIKGLNAAVALSAESFLIAGVDGLLILPADLPLIAPEDVEQLLEDRCHVDTSVKLVPSSDGFGTNALYLSPPNVIRPCFGKDSFRMHAKAAAKCGVPIQIVHNDRISVDVDVQDDLLFVAKHGSSTKTGDYLNRQGIIDQLYARENQTL